MCQSNFVRRAMKNSATEASTAPFTASEARSRLGTSRRVVLPLLEHLDRVGLTRRLPDDRRLIVES